MRMYFVLLWMALVALFSHAEASASVLADKSTLTATNQQSIAADTNVEFASRALRTGGTANEERGGVPGVSTFAGLLSKAGPSAENLANKLWLSARTNPKKVFKSLRLAKAGVKLDGNPTALQWLKFMKEYQTKSWGRRWHDGEIYVFLLQSSKSEADVAKLFQSLQQYPTLATFGKSLQEAQFGSWLIKKFKPSAIQNEFKLGKSLPPNDPRTEIVENYAVVYAKRIGYTPADYTGKLSADDLAYLLKTF